MRSFLPQAGDTRLDESFVDDLVSMWSAKNNMSEWAITTLRRQLMNLHYDCETIRSWKKLVTQWKE